MIEIRIHGRGGQGAVVASEILARAAFRTGYFVQAFPQFGVERRGAPVMAFARLDERPIRRRTHVYEPHHVLVLDPALLDSMDVASGKRPSGWIVINSPRPPESFPLASRWAIATVDASSIAARHGIGTAAQPVVNTAMVGAFAAATGLLPLEHLREAIEETVGSTAAPANWTAAEEAYQALRTASKPRGRKRPPRQDRDSVPDIDLPLIAQSLTSTLENHTGSWRYLEPFYQDLTPPCAARCPVGNDLPMVMRRVQEGDFEGAARSLLQHNPLPAVLGRVCPHPCEQPCNRRAMGGAVQIQGVERVLGDYALEHSLEPELPAADRGAVAVVGSGPAGLSAAYFLRLLGYQVEVYEKEDRPGGLLWSGIPAYRLPRAVLQGELDRLTRIGILFKFGVALGKDVDLEDLCRRYQGLVLAVGQGASRSAGLGDHPDLLDGVDFLRRAHRGEATALGPTVAVLGGGNTALDCARIALRKGSRAVIVYRRSQREMPAFKEDIAHGRQEGVEFEFLAQPVGLDLQEGRITGVRCVRTRLGKKDASGRARPEPVEGSQFVIPADTVLCALGSTVEVDVLRGVEQAAERVLLCGDCVGEEATVADAVRTGREAAFRLHSVLSGAELEESNPLRARGVDDRLALFKHMNRSYFESQPAVLKPVRGPEESRQDFEEVVGALTLEQARGECSRCFKCGTCVQCDNCRLFCPDNAIQWDAVAGAYRVLYEYCKGCGVCAAECPRCAIQMRNVKPAHAEGEDP
ncbi:MAG: 2-oxoacid:acceptor oxidoreductase family protein [Armatimonadetes bacterium]|nr:2-oxoacid:acceptor oxidoreductase family protein [Armatimonadota bacterium]